jgi:uncharacterized protein (DUF362 family)
MSAVSLVKIRKNNFENAIYKSLDLIDYNFSKNTHNVVIKPNLCYYFDYTTGYTTDPNFVAALAKIVRNGISKDVEVNVVESDASAMKCKHAFKMLGYEKMAKRHGLNLVNLSEDECEKAEVTLGNRVMHFMIPRTIEKADLRINVPKIKYTMRSAKMTCALKNIFGCNPYPQKYKYHEQLNQVIVAINKAMKFDLCVVDGNVVFGERARRLGLVISSRDNVSVDSACAKIMGLNPKRIKCLQLAEKEKIGQTSFMVKGNPLDYFATRFPRYGYFTLIKNQAFYYLTKFGVTARLGID